jgi:hypothetical protein
VITFDCLFVYRCTNIKFTSRPLYRIILALQNLSELRNEFRTDFLERDVRCVWTGADPEFGPGLLCSRSELCVHC